MGKTPKGAGELFRDTATDSLTGNRPRTSSRTSGAAPGPLSRNQHAQSG